MFHLYIPNPCRESQILHELAFFCVVFSKPTSCPYSHSQHGVQPQPYSRTAAVHLKLPGYILQKTTL